MFGFASSTQSGQIALIDGTSNNQYAQLYCRSNIFGVQGNIIGIQLEKATKIATSLNVTNPTLASNFGTIDSTGVNIATGLTYKIKQWNRIFIFKNNRWFKCRNN